MPERGKNKADHKEKLSRRESARHGAGPCSESPSEPEPRSKEDATMIGQRHIATRQDGRSARIDLLSSIGTLVGSWFKSWQARRLLAEMQKIQDVGLGGDKVEGLIRRLRVEMAESELQRVAALRATRTENGRWPVVFDTPAQQALGIWREGIDLS
jgi:hypothetical protein